MLKIKLPNDLVHLSVGHIIAQFLAAFGGIFLARIYTPEDFGEFSFFMSFLVIISSFSTLRLESVIILDHENNKSNNFCYLTLIPITIILLFVLPGLVVFLFKDTLWGFDCFFWFVLLFCALLKGVGNIFNNQLLVNSNYNLIKKTKIITATSKIFIQFFLFYIGCSSVGLWFGVFLSLIFNVIYQAKGINRSFDKINIKEKLMFLLKRKDLLLYAFPGDMIGVVSSSIMPLLLIYFFGKNITGVYFLAITILSIATYYCNSVLAPLYFKKASLLYRTNKKELFDYTLKVVKLNFFIAIIIALGIFFLSFYVVDFFLGKEWIGVVFFIKVYVVAYIPTCVYGVISNLEEILSKNKISLIANFVLIVMTFVSVFMFVEIKHFVITMAVLQGLMYAFLLVYFFKELKKESIGNLVSK
ncbi:O-antigen/teichoic acid export membrane protein [Wenyingzhuangia heitensis]|uniref:O-antigen/teichoic acid export membrane protein n=1 Tax=Wenyingzhuangia heitensis TaxID=1487859 RepID=A0ABX0U483_9FLAO|nr:oligosaccharide flippase family protein [Wenyingzhuangia heitensis]NIJ43649.1 O-antigen/teichoic acid export membrane protein [Wenyingzhuangia heitensis]